MRGAILVSVGLLLSTLAGAAAAQSLTWVSMAPQQGAPGTPVTVVVRLAPPIPLAQLSQLFLVFNSADHQGVVAQDAEGTIDNDPVSEITITATVPQGAVTGEVDVALVVAGLPQPLSVGSPQPFQVGSPGTGTVQLTWVSGEPTQGPVGTPVRVVVALNPPVPLSQLQQAFLVFNTADHQGVVAQDGEATADGDPTSRITLVATVPAGAVTGEVDVVVTAVGLPQALSVGSPQPFQVTTATTPPTLTWVGVEPAQGNVGTPVTATVGLNPPVPLSSIQQVLLVFDGGNQQGLNSPDTTAVPVGDPVTQLRVTGSVPTGAITGLMHVVVVVAGLADPVFAVSPTPFQVGAAPPPPPPPPPGGAGTIEVVAGNGTGGFSGEGQPAPIAQLDTPLGIAVDPSGSVYIADSKNHRVRKVTPQSMIITVAGTGEAGFAGDGDLATQAQLNTPSAVAVDAQGFLYIADMGNSRVRRVAPNGVIDTVAGNGLPGVAGDGGPAVAASIAGPSALALDAAGNLYIADNTNNLIRQVAPGGVITTVAGGGSVVGDNGPGTAAQLGDPEALAVDAQGNLYIAEFSGYRVRRLDATSRIITTVVGTGQLGNSGDGGLAVAAELNSPAGVQVDSAGNLYVSDTDNGRIRRVGPDGIIQTVVGIGQFGDSTSGPALQAQLQSPSSLSIDAVGNLFFTDGDAYSGNHRVKKVAGLAAPGLLAGAPFPGSTPPPPPPVSVRGDVNGDGKLDVRDVLLVLQFLVGLKTPTAEQIAAGDVLKQGHLSASGAVLMLRAVAGLIEL